MGINTVFSSNFTYFLFVNRDNSEVIKKNYTL